MRLLTSLTKAYSRGTNIHYYSEGNEKGLFRLHFVSHQIEQEKS